MTFREGSAPIQKTKVCCAAAAILAFALLAAGTSAFFLIGRWLVVEDPLQHTDAIVVLSGRMPQRALEAARLYRQGYATQIWLTRPLEPPELREMHIAYIGEDFYNAQVLMHEGVPENAVRVLEPTIANTIDELQAVRMELVRTGGTGVIIVTSKAHTRRVRTLWRKLSTDARAFVRAASTDDFKPDIWWRDTRDVMDVAREALGLLNAWSGLPIRPAH